MKPVLLKNVKKGAYLTLTNKVKYNEDGEVLEKYVWIKDDYNRSTKKYEINKFDDICRWKELKGERIVYVDFRF